MVVNVGPVVTGDSIRFCERFRKHNATHDSSGLDLSIAQQICRYYGFALNYEFSPAGSRHTLRVGFSPSADRP